MKNKSIYAALILIAAVLTFTSCSDDNPAGPDSRNVTKLFNNNGFQRLDYVVDNWDDGSLNGIVFITKEYNKVYEIYTHNGVVDSSDYEGTYYNINAGLFSSDFKPFDTQNFYINEIQLSGSLEGKYEHTKRLEESDINFGSGTNTIRMDSNSMFNKLIDSVSLGQAVQITDFTRGDTISKSLGYTLNWSGSPSATKAYIEISYTNSSDTKVSPESVISGTSWYQDNTGSVDLKPFLHNITFPGTYDLSVTLYEPHYIDLSNGKKLLVMGESTHKVSFQLTK